MKPEMAFHETLYELEASTGLPIRFAWAILPCHADREGRFKWQPRRLGAQILPYDGVDFGAVLDALVDAGMIQRYEVEGEIYGAIPTFRHHQVTQTREPESKIPEPPGNSVTYSEGIASHVPSQCSGTGEGKGRERNGREGKESDSSEPSADARSKPASPTVIEYPTAGKVKAWQLSEAQLAEWATLYPGLDVLAECRKALAWIKANPGRRKTAGGMARFLTNWLNKATNTGRGVMTNSRGVAADRGPRKMDPRTEADLLLQEAWQVARDREDLDEAKRTKISEELMAALNHESNPIGAVRAVRELHGL